LVPMQEPETVLRLEAPAGVVEARCACRGGRVESVELTNVRSFAERLDVPLGGMWYAIADAAALGFALEPHEARELCEVGERIRLAAKAQLDERVSIVQLAGTWQGVGAVSRNAV